MADNMQEIIRAARNHAAATLSGNDGNPSFGMPENRHSPFDSSLSAGQKIKRPRKSGTRRSRELEVYMWVEGFLRATGSQRDRTAMAVKDAARRLLSKGKDPSTDPFYVAPSIAKGWNLNARQLSEGLKELEQAGHIVVTDRRKGRHLRMTLAMI